jgi:hypothetical protein
LATAWRLLVRRIAGALLAENPRLGSWTSCGRRPVAGSQRTFRNRRRAAGACSDLLAFSSELRVLELERLDRLQASMWDAALEGDIPAVDRVLKVIAARVRLLGLDQSTDKPASGGGGRLVSDSWRPDDTGR